MIDSWMHVKPALARDETANIVDSLTPHNRGHWLGTSGVSTQASWTIDRRDRANVSTRPRGWVLRSATRVLVAAPVVALAVLMTGWAVPLLFTSPGVVAQASASPNPGDPGGNHSKPGDNKKKKKDDGDKSNRDNADQSSRSNDSASRQPESRSTGDTNQNNRWTPDGANRSIDVHGVSPPSPPQQRQPSTEGLPSPVSPADPTSTASPPAPPTTTASSQPPSGQSILNLGQDTAAVQALVDKARPLQEQLDQLRAANWKIRYTGPKDDPGSFTDYVNKEIVIDPQAHQGRADLLTQTVAHEVGHALYGDRTDVSSHEAAVNSMLANEGAATLNNIKMQRWILSQGGPDIGIAGTQTSAYDIVYQNYRFSDGDYAKATAEIGSIFGGLEHPSGDPTKTYAQYYGDWYDNAYG
jgi:hypothetical protein